MGHGASWKVLGTSREGLGASWEGRGRGERFSIYGGTMGLFLLRGRCPKTSRSIRKNVLSDVFVMGVFIMTASDPVLVHNGQ